MWSKESHKNQLSISMVGYVRIQRHKKSLYPDYMKNMLLMCSCVSLKGYFSIVKRITQAPNADIDGLGSKDAKAQEIILSRLDEKIVTRHEIFLY